MGLPLHYISSQLFLAASTATSNALAKWAGAIGRLRHVGGNPVNGYDTACDKVIAWVAALMMMMMMIILIISQFLVLFMAQG